MTVPWRRLERCMLGLGSRMSSGPAARLVAILVTAGMLEFMPFAAAEYSKPADASLSDAAEGRSLMRSGKLEEAVGKLQAAWNSSGDTEVLFDLALCYERLNRDTEAFESFRAYRRLPMALRADEAERHLRSIAARREQGSEPTRRPRRVLVPLTKAGVKCIRDCVQPSSCRPRLKTDWRLCASIQFSCLRACPGAKVESGDCLGDGIHPQTKCVADGEVTSAP
jgi:hypothetical protein